MSKFNGINLNFIGKGVTPGAKTMTSARAELSTEMSINKFNLNAKATEIMGLTIGDSVYMIDAGVDSTSHNDRFYICKGFEANDKVMGARLGSPAKDAITKVKMSFSYSQIWGAILKDDPKVTALSNPDMVREGLVIEYKTAVREDKKTGKMVGGEDAKRATKKARFEVVPIMDEDGEMLDIPVFTDANGDVITAHCYQLTNAFYEEVTEEEVVETETEEVETETAEEAAE